VAPLLIVPVPKAQYCRLYGRASPAASTPSCGNQESATISHLLAGNVMPLASRMDVFLSNGLLVGEDIGNL